MKTADRCETVTAKEDRVLNSTSGSFPARLFYSSTITRHGGRGAALALRGIPCLLAAVIALGCSAAGAGSLSPSASAAVVSDARVGAALVTSCYECHSDLHVAPWHAKLAPSYWFAGSAREVLNFSNWDKYDAQQRSTKLTAIAKTVSAGDMPPWDYKVMHPSVGLSVENKAAIAQWASQAAMPAH